MIIYINDKPYTLDSSCTLQEMLEQREGIAAYVAIAINNQFVPKSMFSNTILCEGDRIDLIVPMQGG
ncbi:sulfur carrier protein ThiS [Fluoribacter gormanii]|uniref:Sulfur carrier protein n=1 Tax=Fluoribacter gormanii TaxID=464 RepID=A0A377GI45_9GAMM|nr:sulfur carrier protein ThiS [Fluoribacter gormanii]KTD03281.1 thiamine biosynthesis protein ThiS [Fluoribacter gormanii]MCW8444247.1 sulfur carrier protein ThiS [Fluoribacter gormanii]MCW8469440.1 sulfur carrier protein ThiS [Fluoribacter gormanii]SIR72503.1 sulfur carrier protein [Fluoribacter gormanii]STO24233.1 Thiamine biosynthesis protein ThiS [Fluoribacter gormanii]